MNTPSQKSLRVSEDVQVALERNTPIVALESTVIAHGLPYPLNIETALACEAAVRREAALPATLGIVDGVPAIGLTEGEIRQFAVGCSPDGRPIEKVSLNNIAGVMLRRSWGATTVAASLKLAQAGGILVFATGGIGGVHRGASESFDISADLIALADTQVICVCAGAKAILDLSKTVEYLETVGVPLIGYGTSEFPAFYSRTSGLPADVVVDNPNDVARLAQLHWHFGARTAALVCVPVPEEFEIKASLINAALDEAMSAVTSRGIRGKAVTPFLLAELRRLTNDRTVETNRELLINNATVAARIAVSVAHQRV